MLIINPIYDSAFKYLMDHTDIAKGIISLLIGETVIELEHLSVAQIAQAYQMTEEEVQNLLNQ